MTTSRVNPITLAGVACYYCGCTETNACILATSEACSWFLKPDRNAYAVCNNPECVKAHIANPLA